MKVLVVANSEQQDEILLKNTNSSAEIVFVNEDTFYGISDNYDALFYLCEKDATTQIKKISGKPVFINSVIETLKQNNYPDNVCRINGWPGFLKRPTWEVASKNIIVASAIFEELGWNAIFVKDEPGLVAARVVSMIINEAFYALGDKISTESEIDNAMKLGTNYPFGPFEWLDKIGVKKIYPLLQSLSQKDKRYSVAPLLKQKYFELTTSL